MNLSDITSKAWILALFKRDDGERFLLGDGWYDFKDSLQHFQPNTIANDIVELQGADGQLLAGQVRRSAAQSFDGYVGDASVNQQTIESRRRDFLMFFRKKHFYTVIYIFPDGSTIQRQRGYLTDDPSVPEMWQFFPEYHVALNFENVNYYEYAEDSDGHEIYSNVREINVSNVIEGGLVWDSLGAVSDPLQWSGKMTASGTAINIASGVKNAPVNIAQIDGETIQNGTPSPSAPVAIQTVTGAQNMTVTGKNLYNATTAETSSSGLTLSADSGYIYLNGNRSSNGSINWANAYFPAGTYKIMLELKSGTISSTSNGGLFYVYGTNTSLSPSQIILSASNPKGSMTVTVSAPTTNLHLNSWARTTETYTNAVIAYQIVAGSTDDYDFEPYQAKSHEIDLGSIELCKIGSSQDYIYKSGGKWYKHAEVGKRVLNGSETWVMASGTCYTAAITDFARSNNVPMSQYYLGSANVSQAGNCPNERIAFITSPTDDRFYIRDTSRFTSQSDITTWLTSNNMTVYYALQTPTDTEITNTALISQLERSAYLKAGANNVMLLPNNTPQGDIAIEYYTQFDGGGGFVWEDGGVGGITTININGVDSALPLWTVTGPTVNPTLTNITTGQSITWTGTIPAGQTLLVDMDKQTATMEGANVYAFISGDWIELEPGTNRLSYAVTGTANPSTLSWNNIVG